jgi:ERCC4-type nuclease
LAYTGDRRGTVAWLAATYRWWQKPWNKHDSHLVIKHGDLQNQNPLVQWMATKKMRVVDDILRGAGVKRSEAASKHFRSIKALVNATEKEWREVPGFGKKLAADFVAEVEREENGL